MTSKCSEILECIKNVIGPIKEEVTINLHEPEFKNSNSLKYLEDCIKTGWVSSAGKWVKEFETRIAEYTGAKNVIAVSNGTVALRLALYSAGVKPNEEVLIPPLSFVATANSVSHLGAIPHFIDIEPETLGMCPVALEKRLKDITVKKGKFLFNKFTGNRISAVLPVHVFGLPAQINSIKKICLNWEIPLIEDAAEALGSWDSADENKRHCGCIGDIGTLSFNGNKIITTGGGGALLTNNKRIADFARHVSTTAKLKHPWDFFHDQIGWNDRLPNLNAALGVAQFEKLEFKLNKKRRLFTTYKEKFSEINSAEIINERENTISNYWLVTLRIKENDESKLLERILQKSHDAGIFLRPAWKLLNDLPMYAKSPSGNLKESFKQSKRLINLPSSPQLIK